MNIVKKPKADVETPLIGMQILSLKIDSNY